MVHAQLAYKYTYMYLGKTSATVLSPLLQECGKRDKKRPALAKSLCSTCIKMTEWSSATRPLIRATTMPINRLSPVITKERMAALRRMLTVGMVLGLSLFYIIISPRKVRLYSTAALQHKKRQTNNIKQ